MAYLEDSFSFSFQGQELKTWFRVSGEIRPSGPAPLVVCQGEPGSSHDHLLPLATLSRSRPVIHYDQFGNGRSARSSAWELFNVDLFVTELAELVAALDLDRYAILGHAWGALIAQEYSVTSARPPSALVLSSGFGSVEHLRNEVWRLLDTLPLESARALQGEPKDSDEVRRALLAFRTRHLCRMQPLPEEINRSIHWVKANPSINRLFTDGLTLGNRISGWSSLDRLERLDLPVLLVSGIYDTATPLLQRELLGQLPNASWHLFKSSSSSAYLEERSRYMDLVSTFLSSLDGS